jgi:hypothetical protein
MGVVGAEVWKKTRRRHHASGRFKDNELIARAQRALPNPDVSAHVSRGACDAFVTLIRVKCGARVIRWRSAPRSHRSPTQRNDPLTSISAMLGGGDGNRTRVQGFAGHSQPSSVSIPSRRACSERRSRLPDPSCPWMHAGFVIIRGIFRVPPCTLGRPRCCVCGLRCRAGRGFGRPVRDGAKSAKATRGDIVGEVPVASLASLARARSLLTVRRRSVRQSLRPRRVRAGLP